jgi:hypothetical protein
MEREYQRSICAVMYILSALFLVLGLPLLGAKDAKMKPEELVAKHLNSIGTPEARAAAKNRVATGASQFSMHLPIGRQLSGPAMVVSEGKMLRISMTFNAQDYPSEQLIFDGNKVNVSRIRSGRRSEPGAFFYTYEVLLREGLFGGTMTTAWALLDVTERQAKLDYTGLKKVDGKRMHELRYRAKKGSGDLTISLHFDPETFRHVHSEYKLIQPANMAAGPEDSSSQRETLYYIQEWFDDFNAVDSLNLPHNYRMVYSREGTGATTLLEYKIVLSNILHNQTSDPKAFAIQ